MNDRFANTLKMSGVVVYGVFAVLQIVSLFIFNWYGLLAVPLCILLMKRLQRVKELKAWELTAHILLIPFMIGFSLQMLLMRL